MLKKVYYKSEKEFWIYTDLQGRFLHVDFNVGDTIDGYEFSDDLQYYTKNETERIADLILTIIQPVIKKKVVEKVSIEAV